MPVPKASVNKKSNFSARKNQVRCPWQVFTMETEAQSETMGNRTHSFFWGGMLRSDCPHILTAFFRQ